MVSDNELIHLFDLPLLAGKSPDETMAHYEKHFRRIGETMMQYDLVIGHRRYDMLEIEAYLTAPDHGHADPYCHGHPLQRRSGAWFFHHVGMSNGFRGGSRKGVDITIGNQQSGSAGGMLIRTLVDQTTGRIIEGPSLLVDEILKQLGHNSIEELVKSRWNDDHPGLCWAKESGFYLEKKDDARPAKKRLKLEENDDDHDQTVYSSCRVGLGLKNALPSIETRLLFVGRPYRFVKKPWLLKKGRIWTIFGMLEQELPTEDIARLTRTTTGLLRKYKKEYDAGRESPLETIKLCLTEKDILAGGAAWKVRVMSAIRWWECQRRDGKPVQLLPV